MLVRVAVDLLGLLILGVIPSGHCSISDRNTHSPSTAAYEHKTIQIAAITARLNTHISATWAKDLSCSCRFAAHPYHLIFFSSLRSYHQEPLCIGWPCSLHGVMCREAANIHKTCQMQHGSNFLSNQKRPDRFAL